MQTFQNVHWQARRLSALEAAEMRSFRRYGAATRWPGRDRRLDKASARRVHRIEWVLEQ